jgi:ribosome biogenesis GTPase A
MALIDNYFLLYQGKNKIDSVTSDIPSDIHSIEDKEYFFETLVLILATKQKNYENFLSLPSFTHAIHLLGGREPYTIETLHEMQIGALELLQKEVKKEDIEHISYALSSLNEADILSNDEYNKLSALLNTLQENPIDSPETKPSSLFEEESFLETKRKLLKRIEELEVIIDSNTLSIRLEKIKQYMKNQTFSIGVTGVMNAGKSTMLNALMHKEILGTSTIPETANLTIIKQGEPKAEVVYWSKNEWQNIVKQNQVNTTLLSDDVGKYIQAESYKQIVPIDQLSFYTSANDNLKRYNLVKYVTLYEQLEFLSKEIEIVDTPGIDDPVIQREEISRGYLAKCDLMMHLMNVSQSATQKDISFIIDAILYQNITKLLIVITRADMVSSSQLQEVVDYTKSSIVQQLKKLNKSGRSDEILNAITFIPISGKMALMHRTGKGEEAKQNGFSLEDTGILKIENYLQETLFGKESSKTDLIIRSTKQQLTDLINEAVDALKYMLLLQSKSQEELEQELEDFQAKKERELKNLEAMKHTLEAYRHETELFLERLKKFLENELLDLQYVLQERVVSEVRYSYEKNKKRIKASEIALIIDIGIKDGMVDVLREYRYKLHKKFQTITDMFYRKCETVTLVDPSDNHQKDTFSLSAKAFQAKFMTFSNQHLIDKVGIALTHTKPSKLSKFESEIEPLLKEAFILIEERILEKSKDLSSILVEDFFEELSTLLLKYKEKLKAKESALVKIVSKENSENEDISNHQKLHQLEAIQKRIKL